MFLSLFLIDQIFQRIIYLTLQKLLICSSTYLYIHWLILICALTGDQTHNLGVLGQHSNQLNHPDRKNHVTILIKFLQQ